MELQGLECSLVDRDPGSKLGPGMTHYLELSCDGLKLWPGCMLNFYCELFHTFLFLVKVPAAVFNGPLVQRP